MTQTIRVLKINTTYNTEVYNSLYTLTTEIEKLDLNRYRNFRQRYSSLLGVMLTKHLQQEEGLEPRPLFHTLTGIPYIKGYQNYLSTTHSEGLVLVASSPARLGIDVGKALLSRDIDKNLFMTNQELNLSVEGYSETDLATAIWTLKESYVKYVGTGFLTNPTDFDFTYQDNRWLLQGLELYSHSEKLTEDMTFSVVTNKPFKLEWVCVTEEDLLNSVPLTTPTR